MNFFVYTVAPVDKGFENLKTVEETRQFIESRVSDFDYSVHGFCSNWEAAKAFAERQGLSGDYRHDPHVFWLPMQDRLVCGFIIKQHENGVTYVISPCELPYLEQSS